MIRFQTLIGMVKSGLASGRCAGHGYVSNPHRYGQKLEGAFQVGHEVLVSNPHRYGQKPPRPGEGPTASWPFQTLIGTVKSSLQSHQAMISVSFQTLIGTVKRNLARAFALPVEPFQTLIGTVKSHSPKTGVSRFGEFQTLIGTVKSSGPIPQLVVFATVSNPHRYGQKYRPAAWLHHTRACFKPS